MSKMDGKESRTLASDTRAESGIAPRWLHIALLAVGLVGWMTFVLACVGGPTWSPDSSKVLFAFRDVDSGRYSVALYDLAKHKTKIILERASPQKEDDDKFALLPAWQRDGTRALILMNEVRSDDKKHCLLFSIPVKSKGVMRTYTLGDTRDCWYRGMVLQQDDRLYFGGDDGLSWVNLTTGETGSKSIKDGSGVVSEHNGQVVYMREVSRPLTGSKDKDSNEDGLEFGRINLTDVTSKPMFTLWQSQTPGVNLADAISVAWESGGPRIALVGPSENSDKILVLDENRGLTDTINPELGVKAVRLGNLIWSRDGKMLFAAAITKGTKEKTCNFSLAEIPLARAPGRLTKIASFQCEDLSEDDGMYSSIEQPIALSPDGNWVAATPSIFDGKKFAEPDRALFLIDLRHRAHSITRIPFPTEPQSTPAATKKRQ